MEGKLGDKVFVIYLGWGQRKKERSQWISCYRARDETGRIDLRSSRRCMSLPSAYLPDWEHWPLGDQGMSAKVGSRAKHWVWEGDQEGMDRAKGMRLQLVFCCTARDETWRLDLGEQREKKSAGYLSLLHVILSMAFQTSTVLFSLFPPYPSALTPPFFPVFLFILTVSWYYFLYLSPLSLFTFLFLSYSNLYFHA